MLATYDKVMLPTILEPMQRQVSECQMPQAQADRMEEFFGSPAGKAINVGTQFLGVIVSTFLVALFVWLGGAFHPRPRVQLSSRARVASWAGWSRFPGSAGERHRIRPRHVAACRAPRVRCAAAGAGGALQALNGLGVFLDAVGPLGIW
jgi:hypothetical protein